MLNIALTLIFQFQGLKFYLNFLHLLIFLSHSTNISRHQLYCRHCAGLCRALGDGREKRYLESEKLGFEGDFRFKHKKALIKKGTSCL